MAFLGGWSGFKKTPKFLRPLLGDAWLDEAGTVGGFAVGGPAGAAAGRGVGKYAATGDIKKGIQGAGEGYLMGAAGAKLGLPGGKLLGGLRVPGMPRSDSGAIPGQVAGPGAPGVNSGGGRAGSVAGDIWGWIKDHPEVVAGTVTAGLGAVQGAREDALDRERMDMSREGIDMLRQRSVQDAPMQDMARKILLGGIPQRRSLGGVFRDPSNPFDREPTYA